MTSFDPKATAKLYDDIADVYSSYYADYAAAVKKQGQDLAAVIRARVNAEKPHVLDCSCGVGTQAIGLALQGFAVAGCDISPKSVEQAERHAAQFGVKGLPFRAADMRDIGTLYAEASFDAVISCGNSLAHLLEQADIEAVLSGAHKILKKGGVFLAALTDHEGKEPRREDQFYDPHIKRGDDGLKTLNYQVWTWIRHDETYVCDDYTVMDEKGGGAAVKKVSAPFRIWKRAQLFELATAQGFSSCEWLLPAETGHHNPILRLTR